MIIWVLSKILTGQRSTIFNELIQLYLVINMASLGYNAKQMKIERPDLKLNSFPYLERVISKVRLYAELLDAEEMFHYRFTSQ